MLVVLDVAARLEAAVDCRVVAERLLAQVELERATGRAGLDDRDLLTGRWVYASLTPDRG
jgi:hypothetical protein